MPSTNKSRNTKVGQKMPPAQALIWVIQGAQSSLEFLREMQIDWEKRREKHLDGALIRDRQGVVADAFTMYIASLFDKRNGTHSLLNAYESRQFISDFKKHPVVKQCIEHRNNRSGHQSEKYGFVVPLEMILSSDLEKWLDFAYYAVATGQFVSKA